MGIITKRERLTHATRANTIFFTFMKFYLSHFNLTKLFLELIGHQLLFLIL
jgi:hypothetical protein